MSDNESDNGNIEVALRYIDKAIRITPDNSILHYKKALFLHELKENKLALNAIDNSIKLNKTEYVSYVTKANILAELNQTDSAFANFDKAIKIAPLKPSIYLDRGLLYEILNQPDKALEDFNKAIQLDSTYYNAYYHRGELISINSKDYKTAIEDFTIMIDNFVPETLTDKLFLGAAYLFRGSCYDLSGDLENACRDFNKASELGLKEADKYLEKCKN
jgi:tetratricopeptide (TPR) repeat protein